MPDKGVSPVGCVAYSVAGRDKKRPFIVIGIADEISGTVLVADGRLHRAASPKRKKMKHLSFTGDRIELPGEITDSVLCEHLKQYSKSGIE